MLKVIFIIIVCASQVGAFSLFDGLYKKVEDNSQKEYKLMDQIAGELGVVKDNQVNLIKEVGEIKVSLAAQGTAIAGVGNKVDQTNMRDDNSTNNVTNSTELLMYIFGGLFGFMTFMCGRLALIIRQMSKQVTQLIERNSTKEQFILKVLGDELKSQK